MFLPALRPLAVLSILCSVLPVQSASAQDDPDSKTL